MKFFYVYVLKSEIDNSTYIGFTSDLVNRLAYHNSGKSRYTKSKKPWDMIYFEAYKDEKIARKREIKLKKSSWHKKTLLGRIFNSDI